MGVQVIHLVMGKANPDRMNGVNKVVHALATEQAQQGNKVRIWGITRTPHAPVKERPVETRLFRDRGRFRLAPELIAAVNEVAATNTVFHIHGGFIPQFSLFARLLNARALSFVYTPHGAHNTVALQRSAWKKRVYIPLFERYLVRNAHRLHFIGASEVEGSRRVFGERPYALIPNGQELPTTAPLKLDGEGNEFPVFGTVGRLDMHTKGLDLLLNGFADFLRQHRGTGRLWLVGDGPDRERLERLARDLRIEEHVTFWGALYGAEKETIMASMDLFCLTSRNEGLPGVVLEAAALQVPCLVSPETNMSGYIAQYQAGFTLARNKAVEKLERDGRSELGHNARTMVARAFNWHLIARQHMANYHG
jgi:glycosyltransferase involved in cell wall biosynthesis